MPAFNGTSEVRSGGTVEFDQDHVDGVGSGSAASGGIVLAALMGRSAAEAAAMFAASAQYELEVIHAFNESRFAALDPKMERRPSA